MDNLPIIAFIQFFLYSVQISYHCIFEISDNKATLGKKILGLYILDNDNQPISFLTSLIRNVIKNFLYLTINLGMYALEYRWAKLFYNYGYSYQGTSEHDSMQAFLITMIFAVPLFISAISLIISSVTSKHQSIHDYFSGTIVVKNQ